MKIATQHAEAVGERPRKCVEEGFLLNRIALRASDVSPGHVERSTAVIADLADTSLSLWNRAAVSAGVAAEPIVFQLVVKARLGFSNLLIEDGAECSHDYPHFSAGRTLTDHSCFLAESRCDWVVRIFRTLGNSWVLRTLSRKYPQYCIEGVRPSAEYTFTTRLSRPAVNLEDHIRDLCARLISASEDEDVAALSEQLRDALREHTQDVRGKLIRASTIPKHTTVPPEKAS
jgi:hypothetical protein